MTAAINSPGRTSIRADISNNVREINAAFKSNPSQVNLSAINNNIKQLGETNLKNEEKKRSCLSGDCGTWTIRAVDGFAILFAIGALVTTIWLAVISGGNSTARKLAIAGAVLVTGAGAWQVIQTCVGREVDAAQGDLRDEQMEQRLFLRFSEAFEQYRRTDGPKVQEEYRNAMKELREVPEEVLKDMKLPPKPVWVESAAFILREKDPENEVTQKLNARMAHVAKASQDKKTFAGEQGHLEPISRIDENIQLQFTEMEELTGIKLPYIAYNQKFYDRQLREYDTWEQAEASTKPRDSHPIDINE